MALWRQTLRPQPAGPAEGELAERSARPRRALGQSLAAARRVPEVAVLVALAGVLNLWALGQNSWANTYYSAAVRSMASSWHDFLFASMDPSGVMTVDKPPLSLWIQALSVRIFGFHPLAILVPQALMGIAAVVLVYDLVRRRFGRAGGFAAGLALATTPIAVAMSRHNNPDMLLTLLCTLAVWFAVRATEDGRTRWLIWSGVAVGLAFEAKMGEALVVVPAIALAWLWLAPRGRLAALRQLLAGGAAMLVVGLAWPVLVWLTPAAGRPYVSGTADNSIWSLIFGYNGLGRINGQAGGPGGGAAGGVFAGGDGVFRLLGSALGGQDGWLLGLATSGALIVLLATRGRRRDPRSAWLAIVGGSFVVTGVLFSVAHGIFHPYYVVLLAPFTAALAGAGVGTLISGDARVNVPLAAAVMLVAGVACELAVRDNWPSQLRFLEWLLPVVCGAAAIALFLTSNPRAQGTAIAVGVAALLIAPTIWAIDTLGYPTQSTFPAGGPALDNAAIGGGGGVGGGRSGGGAFGGRGFAGFGGAPPAGGAGAPASGGGTPSLFGGAGRSAGSSATGRRGFAAGGGFPGFGTGRGGFGARGGGFAGGGFGDGTIPSAILDYVKAHGGGTLVVSSQSEAATAIIDDRTDVAGIGGFSGAESDPSISWFATEVANGTIRWVDPDGGYNPLGNRPGARSVIDAAERACAAVTVPATGTTIYDCRGRAAALRALATTAR